MNANIEKLLCGNCMDLEKYKYKIEQVEREVNGEIISFNRMYAVCNNCGSRITVPGLDDINEKAFERMYRKRYGYIQVDEIESIIKKYDIEKRPLSKLLGLGEHTIENYLKGQLPSKKYSDMLRLVLYNHKIMNEYLRKNRDSVTIKAADHVEEALKYLDCINSVNTKIDKVAHYIAMSAYEITNMSMQKLLYYVDGFAQVLLGRNIFADNCEAWAHGPVFPNIYKKFKSFGNDQIKVESIAIPDLVDEEEKRVIDTVLSAFAIYNGVFLRNLTHLETPWKEARKGYEEYDRCNNIIPKESIGNYFNKINSKYSLSRIECVRQYIYDTIGRA